MRHRNVDPQVAHYRASVAGLTLRGADPDLIARARADLKAAGLAERIRAAAAEWPPLTPAVRNELAVLLLSAGDGDAA